METWIIFFMTRSKGRCIFSHSPVSEEIQTSLSLVTHLCMTACTGRRFFNAHLWMAWRNFRWCVRTFPALNIFATFVNLKINHVSLRTFAAEFFNWKNHQAKTSCHWKSKNRNISLSSFVFCVTVGRERPRWASLEKALYKLALTSTITITIYNQTRNSFSVSESGVSPVPIGSMWNSYFVYETSCR